MIQRGPEITITKGSVSALRHDDLGRLTTIQIDASVNPGNSGGPVIDEKGRVIGVVRIALGTSQMNFAVPVHFLDSLIKKILPDTGQADSAVIAIKSDPPGAYLFVDFKKKGTLPINDLKIKKGWHTLCVLKQGFEAWMDQKILTGMQNIVVTLNPIKEISIFHGKKE